MQTDTALCAMFLFTVMLMQQADQGGGGGGWSSDSSQEGGDALEPARWVFSEEGEITDGEPQCKDAEAHFKHSQSLAPEDVWRMKVVAGRGVIVVGIAAEEYDVERHDETEESTAWVDLLNGTTVIYSGISLDGQDHNHYGHLRPYIPETLPYDLALRISKDGNMPQLRFNEDGDWLDFAEGGVGLKAGPWFPYLMLGPGARLSDLRVDRPRPTKGAGMKKSLAASTASASDGAAAVAVDESAQPAQKKARHDEADGSK